MNRAASTKNVREGYLSSGGNLNGPLDYPLIGTLARDLGFDAAGHPPGNVAVFDPKDILVLKVEPLRVGS